MSQNRYARSATLQQVLVYYDGPQLALLRSSRRHPMLAVGVLRDEMHYGMFAVEVLGNVLERYRYGRADLNFVFRTAPRSRLYFVDFVDLVDGEAKLYRASDEEVANPEFYPGPGIFSRSHTEEWENSSSYTETVKQFRIDGTWEARDFSRFYAKLADIYSLTSIAADLSSDETTDEDVYSLRESIYDKPWQGGGSYLSLYGGAKGHVISNRPLRVASIQYHSPGHIDVAGGEGDLENVISTVQNFITRRTELTRVYKAIHKVLRSNGYLKADKDSIIISSTMNHYIIRQTDRLVEVVGLPNPEKVYAACDRSAIIYVKVVLSFSRRVSDLAAFYIEGRIASDDVNLDFDRSTE